MKTIKYFFITVALFVQSVFSIQAQSTEGTEFWVTFGKNFDLNNPNSPPFALQIRIIGGNQQTSGTIYFTNLNTYIDFDIEPFGIYNHYLNTAQAYAVYNTVTGISNFSVHIIASKPVTVYAFNGMPGGSITYDATNVMPVEALGTEYYQISYMPANGVNIEGDAYAVVATQNNTQIYHNGIPIPEGVLYTGQVYYRKSSKTDMTGNLITSNKPVAFFAVNHAAPIPFGNTSGTSHLFQQLAPVNTWGTTFFVPVTITEKNIVRIVASQNNTDISQTGGTIRYGVPGAQTNLTNLQAGEFVELDIHIDNNGCHIQANKPVGICSYLTAPSYSITGSAPAQCWVPAIEQKITFVKLAPFLVNPPTPKKHYALIVTSTDTKDNTMVSIGGGAPSNLSGGIWKDNIASEMSFYNMQLTNETQSYIFTNSKGLIIFGYGYRTAGSGTYYYLAGSAMRDLDAMFYGNDVHFQDFKESPFCESLIHFRAEIDGKGIELDTVKWFINGTEEIAERNKLVWNKTFSIGEYEIKMWVHFENGDTLSKTGTLVRINCNQESAFYANNVHHAALKDTTFCNKTVNFQAEIDGFIPGKDHLKWYIDDGTGYVEEIAAQDQLNWNKQFATGNYEIKMEVVYENGNTVSLTGTLKMNVLWIKIKNVRY